MSQIKPSSHGIVVEHKGSEVRYAISDKNYDQNVHRKVRDLKPGETVRGFKPLRKGALDGTEQIATQEAEQQEADKNLDLSKTTNKSEASDKGAPNTK